MTTPTDVPFQTFEEFVAGNPYCDYRSSRMLSSPLAMHNGTTRTQAIRALRGSTTGSLNWLSIVETALSSSESSDDNLFFMADQWPLNGVAWNNVKTWLQAGLVSVGGLSNEQFAALQTRAMGDGSF